jgi:hypothetical protein
MNIYKADDSQLNTIFGAASLGCFTAGSFDLWYIPGGTYKLSVDPAGASTGQVTIKLTDTPDVVASTSINGTAAPVTMTMPYQNGYATFSGNAAQQVTVRATSSLSQGIAQITVQRMSDFSTIAQFPVAAGTWGSSAVTLPTTGSYRVFVDPPGSSTGTVSIAVTQP